LNAGKEIVIVAIDQVSVILVKQTIISDNDAGNSILTCAKRISLAALTAIRPTAWQIYCRK